MKKIVHIIGAGLAGSEAAWQAAKRDINVILHEMRPIKMTPAHKTKNFAELVCSNSLRAASLENAVGVLKEEMRKLDSLIMQAADSTKIPAGGALAVDRNEFSEYITNKIKSLNNVEILNEEVNNLDDLIHSAFCILNSALIIASGPLTSGKLADDLKKFVGDDSFYFYDAAAPIVTLESIDFDIAYRASRYDKGGDDAYINCPMNREEYLNFREALINAEKADLHSFEKEIFFEGCLPIEVIAARGEDTLRFGPMKPVGLIDPRTNEVPYAVVQLRQDNREGTLFNLVGFQTHLTFGEQKKILSMIPGLKNAEIVRYGVMHRNTFINSPRLLKPTMQLKSNEKIFFAGQMTGVEGYVESAAAGLIAGINAVRIVNDEEPITFPLESCHGALANYITTETKNFQPMNVNFGLLPPLEFKVKRQDKKMKLAERALKSIDEMNC
ncbi:MAG: methylenetetrahydrofolate--tRNA-(uracil(54)-C(5))-methyltransferase (FADH(2)-oxidizing) TrmFO [Selenomonadaceae bacterium]|nr:methylenetetrahydrofolate--tRNA-(uracil(54)-C(5))-methyltransferase (FADH(2)-oxidizing) TrmFO [Selenomonadaceae bacterium]